MKPGAFPKTPTLHYLEALDQELTEAVRSRSELVTKITENNQKMQKTINLKPIQDAVKRLEDAYAELDVKSFDLKTGAVKRGGEFKVPVLAPKSEQLHRLTGTLSELMPSTPLSYVLPIPKPAISSQNSKVSAIKHVDSSFHPDTSILDLELAKLERRIKYCKEILETDTE